jgi:hypothetical protein
LLADHATPADAVRVRDDAVLDGAWRGDDDDWLPRSRGADDAALLTAYAALERRGWAEDGVVTDAGIAHRQEPEDRLDDLTAAAWRHLGADATDRFVELIDSVGDVLVGRIDATAGPNWMPAARHRPGVDR